MIEVSTAPPWMPWRSSSGENNPSGTPKRDQLVVTDEKPVLRAQILRDQRHRGAVAAMARHHHELPDAGARDAFAERHPAFQRDLASGSVSVPG